MPLYADTNNPQLERSRDKGHLGPPFVRCRVIQEARQPEQLVG